MDATGPVASTLSLPLDGEISSKNGETDNSGTLSD